MMRALRAELRKLLTVRSTYVVLIIVLGLTAAVSFWASGYKADGVLGSYHWQNAMLATITGVSFFVGITPILLITHEYRHNLIYYTLTGIRSRSSVFWAKVAVSALYSLIFFTLVLIVTTAALAAGLRFGGHTLPPQHVIWWPLLWHGGFYLLAITLLAVIFAFIIRNQIGAFVAYLLYPGTAENLLGLLLKKNIGYLPFTAISNVFDHSSPDFSVHKSAVIASTWLVAGLVASWLLFLRRDAN